MSIRFGTAGTSESFKAMGYKDSLDVPEYTAKFGLNAFEYQCGRGVRLGEAKAKVMAQRAAERDIRFSLHAPYFINLSGDSPERIGKNVEYIVHSARVCDWLGGDRIVVHCGGLSGMEREEAMAHTLLNLREALRALESAGLDHIRICVETMGKVNVRGDGPEVCRICRMDERLLPCIDFGHLNARTQGGLRTREDMAALLDLLEDRLGRERG